MTAALQVGREYTVEAAADLTELEAVIADGLRSFVEVGRALAAIRDGELYQEQYGTFEKYCRARWDIGSNYAYKLIASSNVVYTCTERGLTPPDNEGFARALTRIKEPEAQVAAWQRAVETAPEGGITAKHVSAVVEQLHPELAKPVRAPRAATEPVQAQPKPEPAEAEAPRPANVADPSTFDVLEALRTARNADSQFKAWLDTRRTMNKSMPSKEGRMLVFVLDGGEIALARLGLDWSVTPETLKRAYRAACQTAHPDRGGSTEAFHVVTRAHALIKEYLGE